MTETKVSLGQVVSNLRDVVPEQRRVKRELTTQDQADRIQAGIELATDAVVSALGVAPSDIAIAVKKIENVTGKFPKLATHWALREQAGLPNATPEKILEISKEQKWNLDGLKNKSEDQKKAFFDAALVIATMKQVLQRQNYPGGIKPNRDAVEQIKSAMRQAQEQSQSPEPTSTSSEYERIQSEAPPSSSARYNDDDFGED